MTPQLKITAVCTVCDLSWDKHIKQSQKRYRREWDMKHNPGPFEERVPIDDIYNAEVSLLDCVYLLQHVNEGPTGPVGAMGATGSPAPPCMCMQVVGNQSISGITPQVNLPGHLS